MTREEAIEELKSYAYASWGGLNEALEMALAALSPVIRERVEKVWKGEWEDMREAYNDVPKRRCSRCKRVFIGPDTPFCEACGAPMTDEAVEMVMEKINNMEEMTNEH